jgi:hypothetical protein
MRGKRGGIGHLQWFILSAIILLLFLLLLLAFINNSASGGITKQQVLAKQIALLVDSAEAGTELTIEKGNFTVSISKNKVEVSSAGLLSISSTYELLSERELETKQEQDKIIIKIFK